MQRSDPYKLNLGSDRLPQLYFGGNRIVKGFSATPNGPPIVERIIARQPDFFNKEKEIKGQQPKTIVIGCDWSMSKMSFRKKEYIINILEELLKDKKHTFTILAVKGPEHEVKTISSKKEIKKALLYSPFFYISPTDAVTLIVEEKNIPPESLLILDYFEVNKLLSDVGILKSYHEGDVYGSQILASQFSAEIMKELSYRKDKTTILLHQENSLEFLSALENISTNDTNIKLSLKIHTEDSIEQMRDFLVYQNLISSLTLEGESFNKFISIIENNNHYENLISLKKLYLFYPSISDEQLGKLLSAMPNLEELTISLKRQPLKKDFPVFTAEWMNKYPLALQNVKNIDLSFLPSLEPDQLQNMLLRMSKLQKLNLKDCQAVARAITPEWLNKNPTLFKHITSLNLSDTNIDPLSLKIILARAPNLRKLNIKGCKGLPNIFTDDWFKENPHALGRIHEINMQSTDIDANSLQLLSRVNIIKIEKCFSINDNDRKIRNKKNKDYKAAQPADNPKTFNYVFEYEKIEKKQKKEKKPDSAKFDTIKIDDEKKYSEFLVELLGGLAKISVESSINKRTINQGRRPSRHNETHRVDANTKKEKAEFHVNQLFYAISANESPHPSNCRMKVYNHLELNSNVVSKEDAFEISNKDNEGKETDAKLKNVELQPSTEDVIAKKSQYANAVGSTVYYAKLPLVLDSEWQALPSLSASETLLEYHLDNIGRDNYELAYSERDNLYYIRCKDKSTHQVTIDFMLNVPHPHSYLLSEVEAVRDLVEFYKNFGEEELTFQGPGTGREYLDAINKDKTGACRHRAVAFMDAFEKLKPITGFPDAKCRVILNDCHAFVEVRMHLLEPWATYDLGGYDVELHMHKSNEFQNDKMEMKPHFETDVSVYDEKLEAENMAASEAVGNIATSEAIKNLASPDLEVGSLFATWEIDSPFFANEKAYFLHLLAAEEKNCLVDFDDPEAINSFIPLLIDHCHHSSHPVYYIDSPDDLVCMGPYLRMDTEGNGKIVPGRGGPLYDFLENKNDDKKTLIVNWANFSAEDIVKFNSLIDDEERKVDGTIIPPSTKIIGLYSSKDSYMGDDFSRRFDMKSKCPVSTEDLTSSLEELSAFISKGDAASKKDIEPIELYQSTNWKIYLLGNWQLNGESFVFEKGPLLKALEAGQNRVVINNGLWDQPDFQLFWQKLKSEKGITLYGQRFNLPDDFKVITTEGYEWELLAAKHQWHHAAEEQVSKESFALNQETIYYLFARFTSNEDKTITTQKGFLEKNKNQTLPLHLTSELTRDQWGMLLSKAKQHNVTLEITALPNIDIPLDFHQYFSEKPVEPAREIEKNNAVYLSKDRDATIAHLREVYKDEAPRVLDVSEYKAEDLFFVCHPQLKEEEEKCQMLFDLRISDVWSALEKGETLILTGKFSDTLADQVSSLLGNDGYYVINGKKKKYSGKLLIVPEDPTLFKGFSAQPDPVQKTSEIPFVKQATLDKWQFAQETHAEMKLTAPWEGLVKLATTVETEISIAPDLEVDDETFCNAFDASRVNQVEAVWKYSPYGFLAGKTGVGKSTFVKNVLDDKQKYRVYYEEKELLNWINDDKDNITKVLFIDEANLTSCDWSRYEGLFNQPPQLLIDGKYYDLTENHKVLFAGNPLSYGGERHLPSLFERHGGATVFTPLPPRYVAHRILKPFLTTLSEEQQKKVIDTCLELYKYVVSLPYPEILITPREMEMIALLTAMHCSRDMSPADMQSLLCSNINLVVGNIIPKKDKANFDQWLEKTTDVEIKELANLFPANRVDDHHTDDFVLTDDIKKGPYQALRELLSLRAYRQEHAELSTLAKGGLGGLIMEGEPGVGKSQFAKKTLVAHNLKQLNISPKVPLYTKAEKPTDEEIASWPNKNSYLITAEGLFHIDKNKHLQKMEMSEKDFNQLATSLEINPSTLPTEIKCAKELLSNQELKNITQLSGHIHHHKQGFYHIPVSMRHELKFALLEKAFHEGAIVLIDEINASPMMEKLMNALLMGYDSNNKTARRPGFMLIGTQNPITMAGRRAASEAIQRRMIKTHFPNYTPEQLQDIITHKYKNMSKPVAIYLLAEYLKACHYAKAKRKKPAPTPSDLFKMCARYEKHTVHEIYEENKKRQTAKKVASPPVNQTPAPTPTVTTTTTTARPTVTTTTTTLSPSLLGSSLFDHHTSSTEETEEKDKGKSKEKEIKRRERKQ